MVLKRSKLGFNSGNTFRFGKSLHKYRNKGKTSHVLVKAVSLPYNFHEEQERECYDILPDGGIGTTGDIDRRLLFHLPELEYSVNRRKRWELPDMIKDCIAGKLFLEDIGCRLVLVERQLDYDNFVQSLHPDCVGYHDSRLNQSHVYPSSTFSYETDLKEKGRLLEGGTKNANKGEEQDEAEALEEVELRYEFCSVRPLMPHNRYIYKDYHEERRDRPWKGKRKNKLLYVTKHMTPDLLRHFPEGVDDLTKGVKIHPNKRVFTKKKPAPHKHESTRRYRVSLADMCQQYRDNQKKQQISKKMKKRRRVKNELHNTNFNEHKTTRSVHVARAPDVSYSHVQSLDISKESSEEVTKETPVPISTTIIVFEGYDNPVPLQCRLASASLHPKLLQSEFSDAYMEGLCKPRKIGLHLTSSRFPIPENDDVHVLIEVFNGDGLSGLDDDHDNDRKFDTNSSSIIIKSNMVPETADRLHKALLRWIDDTGQCPHYAPVSVTSLVHIICRFLSSMSNDRFSASNETNKRLNTKKCSDFDWILSVFGWKCEIMTDSEAYTILKDEPLFKKKPSLRKQKAISVITGYKSDGDYHCEICFETLRRADSGSFLSGATCLNNCEHWFCVECWLHHISVRMSLGDVTIQCPGYECDQILDHVTLLSLTTYKEYIRHIRHIAHLKIDQSLYWKWCPNVKCHRVVRVHNADAKDELQIIMCQCGFTWCYKCQQTAHWPAECDHAQMYHNMLKQMSGTEESESDVSFVEVKHCPSCRYPMEKNGGCQHMTCTRCRHEYCWECLLPWYNHFRVVRDCADRAVKTQTVEIENYKSHPVSVLKFKKSAILRKLRKHWNNISAHRQFRMLSSKIQKSKRQLMITKAGPLTDLEGQEAEKYVQLLTCIWKYSQQFHFVLEYTNVLLACVNRKAYNRTLTMDFEKLDYIATRIHQLLKEPVDLKQLEGRLNSLVENGKTNCQKLMTKIKQVQRK